MGTVKGIQHIIKTEGMGGLYKGAMATTLKQASNQGLRFMAFEWYKSLDTSYRGEMGKGKVALDPGTAMLGGMFAGLFSTLCNNPFDLIKSRMQGVEGPKLYNGFVDCLVKVVRDEGVLQLWSGLVPRLARVVPGQGIIFASSEMLAQVITDVLQL